MANPRRNKGDIQAQYGLRDLLGLFRDYAKGDIPDSPRQRQAVRNIARDVNLPMALPVASTSLLEAQPQQLATGMMEMSPVKDIVTGETQDMQSMIQPLLSPTQSPLGQPNQTPTNNIQQRQMPQYTKSGNFFAQVGGYQEPTATELQQATPEMLDLYNKQKISARNKGIGEMLTMLSDALGGRDVAMRSLQRQQIKQQGLQSQQQIQRLKGAGFSDQEINLVLAGVTPKDVMELRTEPGLQRRTTEQLTKEVQSEKVELPDSIKRLQKAPQAFGAVDALQQGINVALGPVFGTPAKDTAEAVTEIKVLNERVREKFINQYSGRPSVYLNQRVDQLLPTSMFMDEAVAASKYESTRRVLQEGLNEMKDKIDSKAYSGAELIEVENNYKSIKSLIDDVDVVIRSLKKTSPSQQTLEPTFGMQTQGSYDAYFTN